MLENPLEYYKKLEYFKKTYGYNFIKTIINISSHELYMGNHLHGLILITGDLIFENTQNKQIWGINKSINDSISSKILTRLIEYGINIKNINYYKQTPYQSLIDKKSYTSRYNNNILKKNLQKYLIDDLNKKFDFKLNTTQLTYPKSKNSNQFKKKKVCFNI